MHLEPGDEQRASFRRDIEDLKGACGPVGYDCGPAGRGAPRGSRWPVLDR